MIDITTFLVSVVTLMVLYMLFQSIYKARPTNGKHIPGPRGLSFLGMVLEINPKIFHLQAMPYVEKYGDIFQMTIMGSNVVFLNSMHLIRKCFGEDPLKQLMSDRPPMYYRKLIPEGKGSIATTDIGGGKEHNRLRKAFNKGFYIYGDGVKDFEEKVSKEIGNLLKRLDDSQGKDVDIFSTIQQSVVSIISVLMIGEEILKGDKRYDMLLCYVEGLNSLLTSSINTVLLNMPLMRYVPGPWKKAHEDVTSNLELITKEIVYKQKKSYDPDVVRGVVDYLISLQMEEEKERDSHNGDEEIFFTDGKIVGFLGDVLAGGVGTTRSTVAGAVLCMLHYPEVQKKAQEEVFRVIGKDRKPTLKDKQNCHYIEAICYEVYRFVTIVPFSLPHYSEKETTLEGYHIPAKSVIISNHFYISHDEKFWGDPWTFRPERFLDENGELLPRDHPIRKNVMPFSIGKRRCVGEEFARSRIFLLLASLLQHWTFVKSGDEPKSCDPRSPYYTSDITTGPIPFYCKAMKNF